MKNTAKRSLRAAINEKCRECIHDPFSGFGNWREQTTACTATSCPLYPVRPLTTGQRGTGKAVFTDSMVRSGPDPYQGKGAA